jgi:rhomboid family GlyGly-CTERM serine protease
MSEPRFPSLTISLLTLLAGLHWLVPDRSLLWFSADAIAQGETWRFISGHFVHADTGHLLWNALGLAILGLLIEWRSRSMLLAALVAGVIAVGILLLTPVSPLAHYCGLSGVLNSLLAVALWMEWQASRSWLVIAVACGSLAKVVIEVSTGVSIVSDISWPPWAWSHAAGLVGGLAVMLVRGRPGWVAPVSGFRLNGPFGTTLAIRRRHPPRRLRPHPGASGEALGPCI